MPTRDVKPQKTKQETVRGGESSFSFFFSKENVGKTTLSLYTWDCDVGTSTVRGKEERR